MKDLSSLNVIARANEGFDLRLYDPGTMEDLGITIRVLGKDSTEFRKIQSEQNRRRMSKMSKSGILRLNAISAEELEQDAVQALAACTKGWSTAVDAGSSETKPILLLNGVELPCTVENAVKVYTDFPWIKEQVDVGVSDRANFTKK